MIELTENQKKIIIETYKYIKVNGQAPSVRTLCTLVGLSSTSSISVNLKKLEEMGYITRNKKTKVIESVNWEGLKWLEI